MATKGSATTGIQYQPKACLCSSVDMAAAPTDNAANGTIFGFSCYVTEISKVAGLPRAQLVSKMSAGHEWS